MKNIKIGSGFYIGVGALILTGFIVWGMMSFSDAKREKREKMTSRETALLCTTDMATKFHIHPKIKIIILGEEREIPPNIGVKPTCMNSIHTHEGGGIIHVESPIQKDFTIGDFFAVWKQDFSKEKILDTVINTENTIVVSVNGVEVDTFDETIFKDNDNILIEVK